MITINFIMTLFVTVAWIWGFQYPFREGEILGKPGEWMRNHWPMWVNAPLFDCRFCMASIHGTAFFWFFLGYPWYMWPIFCVGLTGITAMLDRS